MGSGDKSKKRLLENQFPNPIGLGFWFLEHVVRKFSSVGVQFFGGFMNCFGAHPIGLFPHKAQLLFCSTKPNGAIAKYGCLYGRGLLSPERLFQLLDRKQDGTTKIFCRL